MARKIIWSSQALSDLTEIVDYISKDSHFYAASLARELRDASRSLSELSERGRIVPETDQPFIREIFVGRYRLIYKIEESRIIILTIIHGARDGHPLS